MKIGIAGAGLLGELAVKARSFALDMPLHDARYRSALAMTVRDLEISTPDAVFAERVAHIHTTGRALVAVYLLHAVAIVVTSGPG